MLRLKTFMLNAQLTHTTDMKGKKTEEKERKNEVWQLKERQIRQQ